MSEPDLSASTLRKQCVFQWQGRFTMSASDVGLVSSMGRHHLVGAEAVCTEDWCSVGGRNRGVICVKINLCAWGVMGCH
ncbi:hypothetical protein TNCV_3471921 [Trichonephila clavipes]|nr:hypothetical protein TNCV_3471921 [Trichonephila clavipes]